MSSQTIFLLFPGPTYRPTDAFLVRLAGLSQRYRGFVYTTSVTVTELEMDRFRVFTASYGRGGLVSYVRYFLRGLRIAAGLRRGGERVDLVVSYDPLTTGLLGLAMSVMFGARLIIEVNGDYTAKANYIDDKNRVLAQLRAWLFVAMERSVLKRADGIRTLYPDQLKPFQRIVQDKVIYSFFDFVDLRPFRNIEEHPVVLFAGFPFRLKGVDLLIEAFKRIADKHPEWKLSILGWFPDLTEFKRHAGNHPRIEHLRPVPHVEMPKHIGSCGILVLPSRTEAMGRVLLEAMAAGKPRIGARVGGIPTVIEDGRDGLLFTPGDLDELEEKLDRLMSDAALRHALGKAGSKRAREEFSLEQYFEKTFRLYDEVVNARTASLRSSTHIARDEKIS